MNSFQYRLTIAEKLENTFITIFNSSCDQYKIIKYGIETSKLSDVHEFIRNSCDDTSRFVRYIPDSVLINVEKNQQMSNTTLVEFKASTEGIRSEHFFNKLNSECPEMNPSFSKKEDIYNIESDALNLYLKLNQIGVRVIIVAYAGFRSKSDQLHVQFVEKIKICNKYNPNKRGKNVGSGTYIANVNLASFEPLDVFFYNEFGINYDITKKVTEAVENSF